MKMNALKSKLQCPSYIWIIFALVFAFVAFLVLNWVVGTIPLLRNTQVEGFTYKPSSLAPNASVSFGYLDLVNDASAICDFIKIDNALVKSDSSNTFVSSDYTVPKTNLLIYKMYNALSTGTPGVSSSSSSLNDAMDSSYGHLFDAAKLKLLSPQDISAQWLEVNPIQIDDALYNTVHLFVTQSESSSRQCPSGNIVGGLSEYFLQSIMANYTNTNTMQSLKYAYYAVIKPRFLANSLSNMYWANAQSFTNADKGTNDSIVYVLNSLSELIQNPTLAADLSANDAANIIGEKTPFPSDEPIKLYQIASVVYELGRFINQFSMQGSNSKIKTTASTFQAGYPKYLEKSSNTTPKSPFLFILQNPPDPNDCNSMSNLQTSMSSLKY